MNFSHFKSKFKPVPSKENYFCLSFVLHSFLLEFILLTYFINLFFCIPCRFAESVNLNVIPTLAGQKTPLYTLNSHLELTDTDGDFQK